jgi:hypothetical protein
MRPAHDSRDLRAEAFHVPGQRQRAVDVHRDGGQADQIGFEFLNYVSEHRFAVRINHQVEYTDLGACRLQRRGKIGQPQRRRWGFGDGIEGVDEQDAHKFYRSYRSYKTYEENGA